MGEAKRRGTYEERKAEGIISRQEKEKAYRKQVAEYRKSVAGKTKSKQIMSIIAILAATGL